MSITIASGNKLDEQEFDMLAGTVLCEKMMKNRLVLYHGCADPLSDAIDDFVESNVRGLWYKRNAYRSVVYYFEQPTEHAYVANMVLSMIK